MIVSVTRLHLRSLRYLLPFALHAGRARRQAERSPGCLGVQVRKTRGLAFWTLSLWADEPGLRQYLSTGPHRAAMPRLAHWCDTAAVVHWTQEEAAPPSWQEAASRLAATGRLSRVDHPSELHRSGRIDVS